MSVIGALKEKNLAIGDDVWGNAELNWVNPTYNEILGGE